MASFNPRNLLLFGATGNIGTHILDAILTARQEFDRVAIFTSPATAASKKDFLDNLKRSKNVEVLVGDLQDEDAVKKAYEGIDTVISALGRGAIASQIPLIRLADASPTVKWFLPSEYGTDIKYSPASAQEKPHQQKLKVRAFLENENPNEGIVFDLAYTYVVTGPYSDMYVHFAGNPVAGGWDVKAKKATLLGEDGSARVSLTTMKDVGTLVLATLRHPSVAFNRALKVNSFTTTPAEIHAEFVRQTGGQSWPDVQYTSLPQLREAESEAWKAGKPEATILTLRRIWTEGGTLYDQRDNALIGEPPVQTLKDVVAQAIKQSSKL
ncbi:isoflavone reductase family protein [Aspergillus nomiae NRRL 13137]|uniref:Isoflavone reductase family protein n=1 Tax=Aspergillus nomiae NRRL (strain ATCC 15546 / NRRL 13137 / CBS 260.88 / M93) TaxID=1509407 RepID=A0A0L1IU28_ASPN3|nr:isoflavone reductase family protein [Aspergillus nomiae NRRL 13137]KNG82997.1 isoflavone reductase family protein [Aspergillus nomiae NRRL 13137]